MRGSTVIHIASESGEFFLKFFSFLFSTSCLRGSDRRKFSNINPETFVRILSMAASCSWIFQARSDVKRAHASYVSTSDLSHSMSVGHFEEPVYFVARLWIFALPLLNGSSSTIYGSISTRRRCSWMRKNKGGSEEWERVERDRQCIHCIAGYSHERVMCNIEDVRYAIYAQRILLSGQCVNKFAALLTEWFSRKLIS